MKLKQDIIVDGITIPAGTHLKVSNENQLISVSAVLEDLNLPIDTKLAENVLTKNDYSKNIELELYKIPSSAIEIPDVKPAMIKGLPFNAIQKGDSGFDKNGNPITVIDKFDFTDKPLENKLGIQMCEELDVDYENAFIYPEDMEGKSPMILLVSDGNDMFLFPYDDTLIFKINKVEFSELNVNDHLQVASESYNVIAKFNGLGKQPNWARGTKGKQLLLKNSLNKNVVIAFSDLR